MNHTMHSIQDEWLLSYAAGNLTPNRSLLISSYAAFHDQVQKKISDADTIGGSLLEQATPADVDNELLERLLERLDEAPQAKSLKSTTSGNVFPPALADYVGTDCDKLKWHFMGPGMSYVRLWNGPVDERLWLLRAKGGVTIPEHGHTGDEWTLILQGSYQTEFGCYQVGDIDVSDEETCHQPVINEGEDCICLVMTEGPIRMKNLLGRMAQPFIGL